MYDRLIRQVRSGKQLPILAHNDRERDPVIRNPVLIRGRVYANKPVLRMRVKASLSQWLVDERQHSEILNWNVATTSCSRLRSRN
jgi:hypothetical protein